MATSTAAGAALVQLTGAPPEKEPKRRLPVLSVAALLDAQQTLTAVERFSQRHDEQETPVHAQYYRDLIPLTHPKPGEQYAFEVDLDRCTGCKACVTACHSQNGLDEDEVWRTVGLLHGGRADAPAQQTVTTSCHHCVEPACMLGCPTQAYEKDPVTGIVKHLDDQCFGCQYCTLMCPYDAPKYNKSRGIVRKCDMCSSRLSHGEAPACVEACPNGAIAIRIVDRPSIVEASEALHFLPGAPTPEHTLPSTRYKTQKPVPSNMLPADFYTTSPEHSHPPLVVMLTLTQLSVGAFVLGLVAERVAQGPTGSPLAEAVFACALAFLALGASVFHLGRPLLAWRAVLGLRTSWLSREALAFGLFAKLGVLYAASVAAPLLPAFPGKELLASLASPLHRAAALVGLAGVFCSVMVYVATKREQWSAAHTGFKFFGTTVLLGGASVVVVSAFTLPARAVPGSASLMWLVFGAAAVKLCFEVQELSNARNLRQSALKRMAIVMLGDLRNATVLRFALLLAGGLLLPLLIATQHFDAAALRPAALATWLLLVAAELTERYLFFRAAPASRMPGGLR
jgi:Fe-S-cluster-containing dehydrogenase component/DMSO reductase anchor subunit